MIWGKWGIVMKPNVEQVIPLHQGLQKGDEKNLKPCIVCLREEQSVGIHIWDQFICKDCEEEMVRTDTQDEKYLFFIKQMKKIWLKENA